MSLNEHIKNAAEFYLKNGLSVIPLSIVTKQPIIKWMGRIGKPLEEWDYPSSNIAILTGKENGYVVVDCDSQDSYIAWLKHRPATPLRVKSPRGMHFYYQHPGGYIKSDAKIKAPEGFLYDVKGDRSYTIAPPSLKKGVQYSVCVCSGNIRAKWMPPSSLPVFNPEWRPERPQPIYQSSEKIHDARKIIDTLTATEGERDKRFYHVSRVCMEGELSEGEAIAVALSWNQTNCSPPWTAEEVVSKVRRVYAGQ